MTATLSLGDLLWTMIAVFFMVIYFMMLFGVIGDLFRNREMSGFVKAMWILFLFAAPLLSLLIYMIVYGNSMAQRSLDAQRAAQQQMDQYVRETAATGDPTQQIAQAKKLLDDGAITQQEFDALKKKALG